MRLLEVGILIGVSIFTFLPWILLGTLVVLVSLVLAGIAFWIIWISALSAQVVGSAVVGGIALAWLHYKMKARRETKAAVASPPILLKPIRKYLEPKATVVVPFRKATTGAGKLAA
jgi:hypothetical protein